MANPHRVELFAEILHKLSPQQMQLYAHARQLYTVAWLINFWLEFTMGGKNPK